MAKIFQLSPQMANLIAAGEVVERPGSVVKELIENSLDAGAKRITVEIRNGGITYIRVTDDGVGIEREDVRTAFLRHATSKIRTENDLSAIGTLGFRGEALAAVTAVSKVDMFTKRKSDSEGTQISLEAGQELEFTATGCPDGTTITIRNLFFNVPARMKFLKRDVTEGGYVETAVVNAALSRPDVAFKLIKDGKDGFFTSGDGKLSSVIYAVCGGDTYAKMIGITGAFASISVDGYISATSATRANKNMQHFFINGRYVRSRILIAALEEAYKGRLMVGRNALCFINLHVDLSSVDVNVHPAKLEVKFSREKEVFSAIYNSVSSALDAFDDFNEIIIERPHPVVQREDNITKAQQRIEVQTSHKSLVFPETNNNAYKTLADSTHTIYKSKIENKTHENNYDVKQYDFTEVKNIFTPSEREKTQYTIQTPQAETIKTDIVQPHQTCEIIALAEVFNTYIIAQENDTLWLIDKHAAHEKMIFNDLLKAGRGQNAQMLLTPITVALSKADKNLCIENIDSISELGFEIEDFGNDTILVRQTPIYLDEKDAPFVISELAESLRLFKTGAGSIYEELLKNVACRCAIKAGSREELGEMQHLAEKVMSMPDVRNCPHGRPVAVKITRYELEKMFKRIQ